MLPFGMSTFDWASAFRTSSRLMPAVASAPGCICTRTADLAAPLIVTWLTPFTWLSFWPMMESPRSYTSVAGIWSETIAMIMMGASAGFTLR